LLLIIEWQKYYDEALAQEKAPLPTTTLYTSPPSALQQQGWNTVGGKSAGKGGNPWGAQTSKFHIPIQSCAYPAFSSSFFAKEVVLLAFHGFQSSAADIQNI
jgi:hypothetical protein